MVGKRSGTLHKHYNHSQTEWVRAGITLQYSKLTCTIFTAFMHTCEGQWLNEHTCEEQWLNQRSSSIRGDWGMVATRRSRFDSSWERIMKLVEEKIPSPVKKGLGFSKSGENSFFLMKTRGSILPHQPSFKNNDSEYSCVWWHHAAQLNTWWHHATITISNTNKAVVQSTGWWCTGEVMNSIY
jgi:hypothetical protein